MSKRILLLLILLLLPYRALFAAEASLYMFPQTAEYALGDVFTIMILADTAGIKVSAAEGEISYDPSSVELVSVSTDGSLLSTWPTEPLIDSVRGKVSFAGWADEPIESDAALLLTMTFRGIENTAPRILYESGVLLSTESFGSNIVSVLRSGRYIPAPRKVTETENSEVTPDTSNVRTEVAEAPVQALTPLPPPAPFISTYSKSLREGNMIELSGESVPGSKVHIWTTDRNGQAVAVTVQTDSSGNFFYESPDRAVSGVYRLYAVAEDQQGVKSEPSSRVVVNVVPSTLAVAWLAFDTLGAVLIPMFVTLILAGLFLGYLMFRRTKNHEAALE